MASVKGYLRMKSRTHIYLAGPIGAEAVQESNALVALQIGANLRTWGFHPFIPHLCVDWNKKIPQDNYESWMLYDFAWLERCDALLRIPGHSPGADREVDHAKKLKIPVFFDVPALLMWARK